jgi:hypothetical protein
MGEGNIVPNEHYSKTLQETLLNSVSNDFVSCISVWSKTKS